MKFCLGIKVIVLMYQLIFSRATFERGGGGGSIKGDASARNCAIYGTSPANRNDLKHKNRTDSHSAYHYACPVPSESFKNLKKWKSCKLLKLKYRFLHFFLHFLHFIKKMFATFFVDSGTTHFNTSETRVCQISSRLLI